MAVSGVVVAELLAAVEPLLCGWTSISGPDRASLSGPAP